jgi:thioredoxin-related protein
MKFMLLPTLLLIASSLLFPGWETNFDQAKETAKQEHKYILLNFSGSDWCGPCIRMHDEIFGNQIFKQLADSGLVLLNADFPRLKRNQLSKELQKQNEHLAELYNAKGSFPLTVLLTAEGKPLKSWEGYPAVGAEQFVREIKAACDANN